MKGFRAAAALDLFMVLVATVASLVQVSVSQECGSQARGASCADNLCCSQYGYCGTGTDYCGTGCQSNCLCRQSQCGGSPSPSPPTGPGGVGDILTNSLFDSFVPNRYSFYTYAAFISAANSYPSFGTTGSSTQQAQEVAAVCAHVTEETGGLVYINEIDQSQYCDTTYTQYQCAAGQSTMGVDPFNSHGTTTTARRVVRWPTTSLRILTRLPIMQLYHSRQLCGFGQHLPRRNVPVTT
ncbi:unnamed protein product [Sphagnum compactum]